ncbi:hypothetical protein JHJ32_14565 [Parapedobacter sp. ISTM3]|uniref:Uncharacterized protein n=1 Tax=Parapedobacter luteus TaxID=623280 RepID=A0A1T5EB40_9SPHI|nr:MULTISPECIES: DUF2683 family protein [Parapedobacter]MBK1441219.1 hypothetical protein [Parapedobacter sp. ISTM3]SKB81247.1 hypothetical protein SAMN05660226_03228 [Parapedobacter luteus]
MEAIMIHPENAEQLKTVKSVLKALKVPFEPQFSTLPDHVMASIDRGMEQAAQGRTIGLEAFKKKHFLKR